MVRRAVEAVAITGLVALVAGGAALLGLGMSRGIPAIGGATLVAGLVFFRRTRSRPTALLAAFSSLVAAFTLDWFLLFVLGAGYPELRDIRKGPFYPMLAVSVFGAIAALDSRGSNR